MSRSAFNTSAGKLSGPDAFPFFSFSIAFLITFLVGFSMLIGKGVSAGHMSGERRGQRERERVGGGGFRCWSV